MLYTIIEPIPQEVAAIEGDRSVVPGQRSVANLLVGRGEMALKTPPALVWGLDAEEGRQSRT